MEQETEILTSKQSFEKPRQRCQKWRYIDKKTKAVAFGVIFLDCCTELLHYDNYFEDSTVLKTIHKN